MLYAKSQVRKTSACRNRTEAENIAAESLAHDETSSQRSATEPHWRGMATTQQATQVIPDVGLLPHAYSSPSATWEMTPPSGSEQTGTEHTSFTPRPCTRQARERPTSGPTGRRPDCSWYGSAPRWSVRESTTPAGSSCSPPRSGS